MSPELETLDQLLGGPMSTTAIRSLYNNADHFVAAITEMLQSGELKLSAGSVEVPQYRWASVLRLSGADARTQRAKLDITEAGSRRIGG
jgi:hypothetical protein